MFFLCWLCVHIRSLDWPRRYTTTLAWLKALFSKPLYPPGPTLPSRGECDQERSRWTFRDGHLVSFYFLFLFFCFVSLFLFLSHVVPFCLLEELHIHCVVFLFLFFLSPCPSFPNPTVAPLPVFESCPGWLGAQYWRKVSTVQRAAITDVWCIKISSVSLSLVPLHWFYFNSKDPKENNSLYSFKWSLCQSHCHFIELQTPQRFFFWDFKAAKARNC